MSTYQYRVVPAPTKGLKVKGIKGPEARFSNTIEGVMNNMASEGWEYQRAEMLPSVERAGLTGTRTEWRNVLVFRKPRDVNLADSTIPLLAAPVPAESTPAEDSDEGAIEAQDNVADAAPHPHPSGGRGATQMLTDNGVEETSDVAGMTDSLQSLADRRFPDDSKG